MPQEKNPFLVGEVEEKTDSSNPFLIDETTTATDSEKKNQVETAQLPSTNGSQDSQVSPNVFLGRPEQREIPSQPLEGLGGQAQPSVMDSPLASIMPQQEQAQEQALQAPQDPYALQSTEVPFDIEEPQINPELDDSYGLLEEQRVESQRILQNERNANNTNLGLNVDDADLPDMMSYPIEGVSDNIDETKSYLSKQVGRARIFAKRVIDNPKAYGLPSDITTMNEDDIKHAQTAFVNKNEELLNSMMLMQKERAININEGVLRSIFLNEMSKENASREEDRFASDRDEIANSLRASGVSEDKIEANMFRRVALDDVRKMSPDERAVYENNETQKELADKINETKVPLRTNELMDQYNEAVQKGKELKSKIGEDRMSYVNFLTGNHVDKITNDEEVDITESVNAKKEEYKSLKENIQDLYMKTAIKEQSHRKYGKEDKQDVTIGRVFRESGVAASKLHSLGYEGKKDETGKYVFKNVSLSDLAIPIVLQALSNEDQKEPERWAEKNRELIIERVAARDMALLNIDFGKVEKEKITRGVEILGEETIGSAWTEELFSGNYSDRKLLDAVKPLLEEQGIEITEEQEKNFERTLGEEISEGVFAMAPFVVKIGVLSAILGPLAAKAGLTRAIAVLSKGTRVQKFQAAFLQASYEEVLMGGAGLDLGTGFGFSGSRSVLKGLGLAKSPIRGLGVLARGNKAADAVWTSGISGGIASEGASNLESLVKDFEGSSTYEEFINENYSDISETARRIFVNSAVFTIMAGKQVVWGKGSTGFSVKRMEEAKAEFLKSGREAEAKQIGIYISEIINAEGKAKKAEKKADKEKVNATEQTAKTNADLEKKNGAEAENLDQKEADEIAEVEAKHREKTDKEFDDKGFADKEDVADIEAAEKLRGFDRFIDQFLGYKKDNAKRAKKYIEQAKKEYADATITPKRVVERSKKELEALENMEPVAEGESTEAKEPSLLKRLFTGKYEDIEVKLTQEQINERITETKNALEFWEKEVDFAEKQKAESPKEKEIEAIKEKYGKLRGEETAVEKAPKEEVAPEIEPITKTTYNYERKQQENLDKFNYFEEDGKFFKIKKTTEGKQQEGEVSDVEGEKKEDNTIVVVSASVKSALDSGRKKQVTTVDADGKTVVEEVEFTKEDAELELDRLEALAEKGRLTPEEFQKSYFGQTSDSVTFKAASEKIKESPKKFIADLKESFNDTKPKSNEVQQAETKQSKSDDIVDKAREGDADALAQMEEYGIDHKKNRTYRFVADGEVEAIIGGEKVEGRFKDTGVDVTNSKDVTTAASAENRVTFKDTNEFDDKKSGSRVKPKNETDSHLKGGYTLKDVEKIEKKNEKGEWETVYDSKKQKQDEIQEQKPQESKPAEKESGESVEGKQAEEKEVLEVKSFKKGDGGTLGIFKGKDGKVYKSVESLYNEYDSAKKKFFKKKTGKETEEHQFLEDNKDLKHLPKVGKIVETSEGKAFEIEELSEVDKGSLTLEEINTIQETIDKLNSRGVFIEDLNSVMRRDNGEIVLIDLSHATKRDSKRESGEKVSSNIVELLDKKDQTRHLANRKAEHVKNHKENFLGKTEPKTEFTYLLTQRPPSIGTHPEGQIRDAVETTLEGGKRKAYKITYDRPLTEKEIKNYELTEELTMDDVGRQFVSSSGSIVKVITNVSEKDGVSIETFLNGKSKEKTVSQRRVKKELENSSEITKEKPTEEKVGSETPEYEDLKKKIPVAQEIDGENRHEVTTTKEIAEMLGVSTKEAFSIMEKLEKEGNAFKYGYKTKKGWDDIKSTGQRANSVGWQLSSKPEAKKAESKKTEDPRDKDLDKNTNTFKDEVFAEAKKQGVDTKELDVENIKDTYRETIQTAKEYIDQHVKEKKAPKPKAVADKKKAEPKSASDIRNEIKKLQQKADELGDNFEFDKAKEIEDKIIELVKTLPEESISEKKFTEEEKSKAFDEKAEEDAKAFKEGHSFKEVEDDFTPISIVEYEQANGKGSYKENKQNLRGLVTKEGSKQSIDTRQKSDKEDIEFYNPEDILKYIDAVAFDKAATGETKYTVPKSKVTKRTAPKKKAPEKVDTQEFLDSLASKIRGKKVDGGKLMMMPDLGISVALYNTAVEMVAKQVEKGTKLGTAIANAMKFIDERRKGKKWNKGAFGKAMSDEFKIKVNGKEVDVKVDTSKETAEVVNGFYQPIEQKILDGKKESRTAKEWGDILKSKENEDLYTGVREFLESKKPNEKVSKKELQEFMRDNRIEVVEVVKGDNKVLSKSEMENLGFSFTKEGEYHVVTPPKGKEYDFESISNTDLNEVIKSAQSAYSIDVDFGKEKPKYSDQQLEGEKTDYKEVLVTLPSKTLSINDRNAISKKKFNLNYTQLSIKQQDAVDGELGGGEQSNYRSSHWDEPNILVHVRMNTRTDANGKKVLFVEEVQSDMGQAGKKEGFKEYKDVDEIQETHDKLKKESERLEAIAWNHLRELRKSEDKPLTMKDGMDIDAELKKKYEDYNKAEKKRQKAGVDARKEEGKIPSAPFVTDTNSWVKLGIKTALKEAVAQEADYIAWTTGEQQNARYDLSKQVDAIDYSKRDGKYSLFIDKNGQEVGKYEDLNESQLEDYVGKEVAQKIINKEGKKGGDTTRLSGLDLKVGGKGMKGFYGEPSKAAKKGELSIEKESEKKFHVKDKDGNTISTEESEKGAKSFIDNYGDGIVGNVAKSLVKDLTGKEGVIGEMLLPMGLSGKELAEVNRIREKAEKDLDSLTFEEQTQLNELTERRGDQKSISQPSIQITPELAQSVKEGMPLFSASKKVNTAEFLRGLAEKLEKGKIGDDVLMSGLPFLKQSINGIITVAQKTLGATARVSEIIDFVIAEIRKDEGYRKLKDSTRKALNLRKTLLETLEISEEAYFEDKIKGQQEKFKEEKKGAVKEAKKESSEKLKEKLKEERKKTSEAKKTVTQKQKDKYATAGYRIGEAFGKLAGESKGKKDGVKLGAKQQKEFAKVVKETLTDLIKEVKAENPKIKITAQQLSALTKKLLDVNFNSPLSAERAIEYTKKALEKATFIDDVSSVKAIQKKANALSKQDKVPANHRELLSEISKLDLALIEDMAELKEKVSDYMRTFLPSTNKNYKQGNSKDLFNYLENAIKEGAKNEDLRISEALSKKLSEDNVDVDGFSPKEIKEIYDAIYSEDPAKALDELPESKQDKALAVLKHVSAIVQTALKTFVPETKTSFKDREAISVLRNSDILTLPKETLAEYIRFTDNLIENGSMNGVWGLAERIKANNAITESKKLSKGVKKLPFFTVGKYNPQKLFTSTSDVFRSIFGYDSQTNNTATKIMNAMGFTDAQMGYAKKYTEIQEYTERINKLYETLSNKANSPKNRLSESIASLLMQPTKGMTELESIENYRDLIEQHIEELSKFKEHKGEASMIAELLTEFKDAKNPEDVKRIFKELYPENAKVIEVLMKQSEAKKERFKEHDEKFYNGQSDYDNPNYFPVKYKKSPTKNPEDKSQVQSTDKPIQPKRQKNSIKRVAHKKLPAFRVFDTNARGVHANVMAEQIGKVYSDGGWARVNEFLKSKEIDEIFGGPENANMVKNSLRHVQDVHTDAQFDPDGVNRLLGDAISGLRTLTSGWALGSIGQLFKQAPDQFVNASTYLGKGAKHLPKYMEWNARQEASPLTKKFPITFRESTRGGSKFDSAIETEMTKIERFMSEGKWLKAKRVFSKVMDLKFLAMKKSDLYATQASWLAAYEYYLESAGKPLAVKDKYTDWVTEAELIETDNVRKEAAQFAENMVNMTQGSSDASQLPRITNKATNNWENLAKLSYAPFLFTQSQHTSRTISDVRDIANNRSKGRAIRSFASTASGQLMFQAVSKLLLPAIITAGATAVASLFGFEEKDDEKTIKKKKEKSALALKRWYTDALTATIVPPLTAVPAQVSVDAINSTYYTIALQLQLDEVYDSKGKIIPRDEFVKNAEITPLARYDQKSGEWKVGMGHMNVMGMQYYYANKTAESFDEFKDDPELRGIAYAQTLSEALYTAGLNDKLVNKVFREAFKIAKANKKPTAKGILSTESKEEKAERETAKQAGVDAISAKQKTPSYVSTAPYSQANAYMKAANKGRKTKMKIETAKTEIAEQHNIELFKSATKDKALLSSFITTDGEGNTVRTAESLAANYIDNVINAKDSKVKNPNKLAPEHEAILKNMLKHEPKKKYAFAREVNKEIARQKKVLEDKKREKADKKDKAIQSIKNIGTE
tara:strand:- start:3605 stop:16288 length:12684 start_codon:yes stop_codon:yes gene_type:complete